MFADCSIAKSGKYIVAQLALSRTILGPQLVLNITDGTILSSFSIADNYETIIRSLVQPSFISMP
jgi:hypothetical protein